ncbi:MAG TPA: translation initiation factor IF-2 [Sphingorhabdus sp.]|jgi:translation initiation factor IF-2|uniref:translation initiation factor IF-2 n=1 Tax=Sphingorhabdus sp. TaxID=1902408 RepID=UPI002BC95B6E|nr:translation initiation factor IF-2 [Sphingorhabdus sp.]HMT41173.1 translation initiation factor IF-2 [Sphingorhabdus sp.]HMU21525.1 translation initiation factor IF-2 [Sphingorhabdus sp.]
MSDENENKPTLGRKPLGLKPRLESGEVKQTFSHGRTNKVVVEVKRKKLVGKPGYAPEPEVAAPPPPPPPPPPPAAPAPRAAAPSGETPQERVARLQREAEEDRLRLAEEANRREQEERARAADEERRRAEENRKAEAEAAKAPPPAVAQADEVEAAETSDAVSPPPARRFTPVESPKRPAPAAPREEVRGVREEVRREDPKKVPHKPSRDRAGDSRRQSGKLTVTRALDDDEGARARSLAALKRAREKERRSHMSGMQRDAQPKQVRDVVVPEVITVQELAIRMAEKGSDLVKALFKMGMPVTLTQSIDQDTAELLVTEFGHNITRVSDADVDIAHDDDVDAPETLKPRPPVVTVMGHVDHGKTSLLDALRGANVQAGEAGGITQHIGAYQVKTKNGDLITFLDTPGHEAFTEMRARGATVTDIIILVVAADDGIMPQTIEAINHARSANVPMIIAINKCDKDGANPQRIRERLLEHEVIVEKMGGEVQDVEISALKKTGIDDLLDKLALQAELMELKANPDRAAEAVVVEAKLDKGRGAVATLLIRRGTLKTGDIFVVGEESGKVRALINDQGQQVKTAGPAMPVEVLGLTGVPGAGEILTVVENEARAREVAAFRKEQAKLKRTTQAPVSVDNMFSALAANRAKEYAVVVKADVQGSVEAIVNALHKISTDEIKVRVLQSGVGAITESDVTLANATKAPIIGFNVRPNAKAREIAQREKTRFKYFDVIYHLTEDVAKEMAGILGPEIIETVVGRAKIQEVFNAGKKDKAAGLLVLEGHIRKGYHTRLTREDVIVSKTVIASLRRFKDDVDEVRAGLECGVVLQDTNDIKAGDMLEIFEVEERERTL